MCISIVGHVRKVMRPIVCLHMYIEGFSPVNTIRRMGLRKVLKCYLSFIDDSGLYCGFVADVREKRKKYDI
jgi:hypothetical protein